MANYKFEKFENGVVIVNTTPHPVSIQDVDGTLVSVPSSCVLNASAVEEQVSDLFVRTAFVGTKEGLDLIADIESAFDGEGTLVILGSIIAAQAYPGKVSGLCPVPGYERVAPSEKRMRCDKFTTFAK